MPKNRTDGSVASTNKALKNIEAYAIAALAGGGGGGGATLPIAATDVTEDNTHRFVTDANKTSWNNKLSSVTTGDIEITDFTKGIIWKVPDGSRWRVTMDNTGHLISTKL